MNLFKNKIKNLYGFDPVANPNLDQLCSVQCFDTEPESVDVALCLGSLQYVPRSDQLHQLRRIVSWIKPKGLIVMRSMPFVDYTEHNEKFLLDLKHVYNQRLSWKDFHDWTEICNLAIYRSVALECNKNFPNIQRLSWWWQKNI